MSRSPHRSRNRNRNTNVAYDSDERTNDDGMIPPFQNMFNCATTEDPFTQDPSTSPYEYDMQDDDDDDDLAQLQQRNVAKPNPLARNNSYSTIETGGISLHETEHVLEDGTKVIRTETVDNKGGWVYQVNQSRRLPNGTIVEEEPTSLAKLPNPKKTTPAAMATLPRSSSPVPPPPPEEKKEEVIRMMFPPFNPSFEEFNQENNNNDETNSNNNNGDQEKGDAKPQDAKADSPPQKEKEDEDNDDDEKCGLPKRLFYFMVCIIVLILLIAGIVGGIMASSSDSPATAEATAPSENDPPTTTVIITPAPLPTTPPMEFVVGTPAPSLAPVVSGLTEEIAQLGGILLPEENLQTLSIFSPSYRALEWLLEDDDTETNLGISLQEDSQELQERFAIASLYFATNGKGWVNSDKWLTPVSVCGWEGVSCRDGNVTSLVFNANRLEGEIPTTLGALSWLEILNLPQNALGGTLGTELGQLTNLEIMNIYSNSIEGTIPTEMGNLQQMVELTLWFNNLNGNLPSELGQLSALEKLDVAQNALTGAIPTHFGNLRSVRKVFFDGNSLSGPLPSELGNLGRLELWHVPNNRLSGIVPSELENAPNLNDLKLSANSFSGGLENLFCGRTMTQFYADCSSASLSCPCCTHCCGSGDCSEQTTTLAPTMAPTSRLGTFADILIGPNLEQQNAILQDTNSPQFKALMWINDQDYPPENVIEDTPSLQERYGLAVFYYATGGDTSWSNNNMWLSPGINHCDWEFVACIATQVRFLTIVNNNLVGSIPTEIAKVSSLRMLELRNHPMIPSKIPTELGNMRFLSHLSLESISLTGTIPTQLMRLQFLTNLELSQNDLTGNIPTRIQQLFNLKFLNLASNALDGGLPTELATLRLLQSIELHENALSGQIPIEWGAQILSPQPQIGLIPSFEFLERLRLDQNQLTGNLPPQVGELKGLRELHLQNNQFTGVLPTQLMDLPVLQYLKASTNQLRGTLHTYIGNLQKLSYFDVSENEFSGSVPTEFGSLTSLTSLSLAFNPLTGEIPTSFTNLIRMDNIFLQGTKLVGGLDTIFCDRRLTLFFSDCLQIGGTDLAEIDCSCCNFCCDAFGSQCTPVQV